ncbi:phage major capsid protein [uncultured Megasphaera sp.]|uniref:phage major capsid protein n=1 Tax=uncultured Megasphaera sp. TaxID=165188 RepID=UPI002602A17E|nr:phage major capsid protein [uncultured Megasphaera sp.]
MKLKDIETRKAQIAEECKKASGADLDKLYKEMNDLKAKEEEIRKQQDEMEKRKYIADQINKNEIVTKKIDEKKEPNNMYTVDSNEYRKAFMNYVLSGEMTPEFRSVATTADNGAVIPTAVMNTVVEKMEQYGNILPLVRKLSYPAGVVVPTSALATEAKWMQEGAAVDVNGKSTVAVTFGAYELAAAIGISFKAHIQSLSAFEAAVAENVSRAMVKALEKAIISGDGAAKPKGIVTETVPEAQKVTLSAKLGYKDIVNMVKAIPSAYKDGAVLTMNENTFLDMATVVDNNGQPVAHVNYGVDGEPIAALLGKKVVFTDYLPDLTSAKAGDVVAFAFQYDKYILNTAYQMDLVTYTEDATRNKVYQSIGMYDGKVVDNNGLVLVVVPASK